MTLQSSGAISLANIQTEFGGSNPIGLSEYYRNGNYVPSSATTIPTSGTIQLDDFYGSEAAVVLTISTNATNYNILTAAVAAGFNNSVGGVIHLTINSGVTVSGSSAAAIVTGALHASTTLTITNNGTVSGYTGATSTTAGQAGSVGGDALDVGGGGTTTVTNNGTFGGGKGGGGGPGIGTSAWEDYENNQWVCNTGAQHTYTGNSGAAGTNLGDAGSAGTLHGSVFTSGPNCTTTAVGAGGAAGYAVKKNGNTVNTSGTFLGTVS